MELGGKGQCYSLRGRKGARSLVETGSPERGVYLEGEDSEFSFRTSEFLSIKFIKDQSPSNKLVIN